MAPLTSTGEQHISCGTHIIIYLCIRPQAAAGCRWVGGMVGVSGVGVPYNVRYNVHIYIRIGVPHGVRVGG